MTIVEKAAYLKGLAEGLGVTPETKEGKLWAALCELMSDVAHELEELQASHLDLADAVDELTDDLNLLADCCDPEYSDDDDEDDEDDEENDGDDEDDEDDEDGYRGVLYDVTCPVCGEEITLDEEMLAEGSIDCPACGEALEFDLGDADGDA